MFVYLNDANAQKKKEKEIKVMIKLKSEKKSSSMEKIIKNYRFVIFIKVMRIKLRIFLQSVDEFS